MDKIVDSFVDRFNTALAKRNIRPTELAEKTQLSRSTISHYMRGYTQPKSDKLFILSKALDVSEQWLMGFDVPMERRSLNFSTTPDDCPFNSALAKLRNNDYNLTKEEHEAIEEELPMVMEKAANAFNGFFHNISDIYEKEKARQLLGNFRALNCVGQDKAIEQVELLTKIPEYQNNKITQIVNPIPDKDYLLPQAAHERTDIEVTNEMRKHDDEIMDDDDFWKDK